MNQDIQRIRDAIEVARVSAEEARRDVNKLECEYKNAVMGWAKRLAEEMDQEMVDALDRALKDCGKSPTKMYEVEDGDAI